MREKGARFEQVDLSKGLSFEQLEAVIGERDYRQFLSPRHFKSQPPPREEALRLMSKDPNLIRRPILVKGKQFVPGFDPERYGKMV